MRPDIAFVVGYVSRFMEDPREDHWAAMKWLLRYVKGTVDHGIIFPKTGKSRLQLIVFSDADMAGDIERRQSTSGVLVFLGSTPISWLSLKQKVVALSTCEADKERRRRKPPYCDTVALQVQAPHGSPAAL
ncbi:secreted RxLR effector protein 161-like [Miscanthus floridulus]|uniref:secreted RxLR effector protein 161-like n=1 Tax=Miscanthus floridulus TaxID=154761 RepID=UPI003459A14C